MSVASVSLTCLKPGGLVTGNMISGAAQFHKRRPTILRKTEAMTLAERQNGSILDEIWREGAIESFQIMLKQPLSSISTKFEDKTIPNNGPDNSLKQDQKLNEYTQLLIPNKYNNISSNNDKEHLMLPLSINYSLTNKRTLASINETNPSTSSMILRLNIGGTHFIILVDAILRADQSSFLAKFVHLSHSARIKVADAYLSQEDAYYFQRSPVAFELIFQYYATGVIHRPLEICSTMLSTELNFWRIPISNMGACCSDDISLNHKQMLDEDDNVDDTAFEKLVCGKLRRRMWTFLERPGSSHQAKAFELSSTLFVAISVMGLSFGTIPEFQVTELVPSITEPIKLANNTWTQKEKMIEVRTEHPAFIFTERICIAFFTVEYCLRMFAAPKKLKFMFKPLNLVDLLAVLPFYLELILTLCGVDDKKLRDLRWAFLVVRILRVLRVIRIIKLGRFSSGLQTFGMTLKRSQKQLQMMTIVLLTGVVFFSTMIYFLEKDELGTPFTSIPAAYWWCIVTMTTVGYGDVVPVTTMGKIIASAAIMSGVLVLALPITIIVDNFIKVAQDEQQAEQYKEMELNISEKELLIK